MDRKAEYDAYLLTDVWASLRAQALERDGHRCRLCDAPATEVHHRRYPAVFGQETVDDLTSLCTFHHQLVHGQVGQEEWRAFVEDGKRKGIKCPTCDSFVKVYRRVFNSNMAKVLIGIYKHTKEAMPVDGWIQVSQNIRRLQATANAGEYGYLRHWGLIEENPGDHGYWRITEAGIAFVEKRLKVKSHVIGSGGDYKPDEDAKDYTILDALKTAFDYDELMAG